MGSEALQMAHGVRTCLPLAEGISWTPGSVPVTVASVSCHDFVVMALGQVPWCVEGKDSA